MAPTIVTRTEFVVRPTRDSTVVIEQVTRTERTDSAGRRLQAKDTVRRNTVGEFTKEQVCSLITALVTEVTYVYAYGEDEDES